MAIKRAAGRLTSATAVLRQGKSAHSPAASIEDAITQYEHVEEDVAQAAHDLTQVNSDLSVQVRERVGIELELAETKADLATARDDLSESRANEHDALHLALHDPLTGLPNRGLFDESLDHGLSQASRHGWRLAVLFIDIDDFKAINDLHGHHVGDDVLLMIAHRLRSFVRAEDIVSRWGGDEFVCLLLEAGNDEEIVGLAQGMIDRIAAELRSGGVSLSVGCSIGIAVYPRDGESADVLLKNADVAMYRAKGTSKAVLFG